MGGLCGHVRTATSMDVLMLAFMDREAWERTLATGEAPLLQPHPAKTRFWHKGGHFRPRAAGQGDSSWTATGYGAA